MISPSTKTAIQAVEEVFGGYAPGFNLRHGAAPEAVEHFMVISRGGAPRLILPSANDAMRVALSQFLGPRPWIGLAPSVIHFAAKLRISESRVAEMSLTSHSGEPSQLRKFLCTVLGREDFYLALRISFGRPNAKTVALAVSHDGDALCFAKIGSEAMTNDLVIHEGKVLQRLKGIKSPIVTPHMLYGDVWEQGRHILITEPLKLEPLPGDAHIAHCAADFFTTANPIIRSALRDSEFWNRMGERITGLGRLDSQYEILGTALSLIDKRWGASVLDFGACHGDWSRANLGLVGGRVAAFDWERFSEQSPRGTDIAHFAICEFTRRSGRPTLDIERVVEKTRRFLAAAGLPIATAELLVILDCLEMLIRFVSARKAGVESDDSAFGNALRDGLQKWAT